MPKTDQALRDHLIRLLDWDEAHIGFDKAVANLSPARRGERVPGVAHTVWELVEHLRLAQEDLLDFCVNAHYVHDRQWPDDYWPTSVAPADEAEWQASLDAFAASCDALKGVVRTVDDLTARVPAGKAPQTYLRSILLAADHAAYHVGQIVIVRQALGEWGPKLP